MSDSVAAWIALIRIALVRPTRQLSFDAGDFVECDACTAKPGTPTLCAGCLANRHTITNLKRVK